MSANDNMSEPMKRVSYDETRIAVEMTHEQYGSIAAALLLITFDRTLTPELIEEYKKMRELFISSPIVFTHAPIAGLSD